MSKFGNEQQVRIIERYDDSPEDSVMYGKTGRVVAIIGESVHVRIDLDQGEMSGKLMAYTEDLLERITPKRRLTLYAIGEGTTEEAFRKALTNGPVVMTTGDVGKCHTVLQRLLGEEATVSVWGFDVYVDPDNLPNYWNA